MDETRYAKIAPIVLKVIHQSESFKSLTKASKKRLIDALTEKVGEVKDFRQAERGDLLVFATSAKQKKQILQLRELDHQEIECTTTAAARKALIHRVATDLDDETILTALEDQGVIHATRWNKIQVDGGKQKSETVCITFSGERRREVKIDYMAFKCFEYIPRPLICYRCWLPGHIARACKSQEKCRVCSGPHSDPECTKAPTCPTCQASGHIAATKDCPIFASRQRTITTRGAYTSELGISASTAEERKQWQQEGNKITNLEERLNRIEERISEITNKTSPEPTDSHQGAMASLQNKVNRMEEDMEEVKSKIKSLDSLRMEVNNMNQSMKESFAELKEYLMRNEPPNSQPGDTPKSYPIAPPTLTKTTNLKRGPSGDLTTRSNQPPKLMKKMSYGQKAGSPRTNHE